jgi:triacylglycerol lipase
MVDQPLLHKGLILRAELRQRHRTILSIEHKDDLFTLNPPHGDLDHTAGRILPRTSIYHPYPGQNNTEKTEQFHLHIETSNYYPATTRYGAMPLKPIPDRYSPLISPPVRPLQGEGKDNGRYRYFDQCAQHPFDGRAQRLSMRHAWWLAECAMAAYCDLDDARSIFAAGGLAIERDQAIQGATQGGQCYVVSNADAIIVTFRGTRVPQSQDFIASIKASITDALTDAMILPTHWTGPAKGNVHMGFAHSAADLLPEVKDAIDRLNRDKPGRSLWITGHSLGAALATLASDYLPGVTAVCHFGCPRVGDATFADNHSAKDRMWRFRNHGDAVPALFIPRLRHVGECCYFDAQGRPQLEPTQTELAAERLSKMLPKAGNWRKYFKFSTYFGIGRSASTTLHSSWNAVTTGNFAAFADESFIEHAPVHYAVRVWNAYTADP